MTAQLPEGASIAGTGIPDLFGALISRERSRRHWTLRELSARTGVALMTCHRAECGTGDVMLTSALRIASELGIHLCDLMDPTPCQGCQNSPPAGFTCNECGRSLP